MKLLRFLIALFIIYFIRRLYQGYVAMKALNEAQAQELAKRRQEETQGQGQGSKTVDAEFKVVDK